MKLALFFVTLLILSVTLVCLVSADGMNIPGQQNLPNHEQPTPTPPQVTPGTLQSPTGQQSGSGTGPAVTRQPVPVSTQEPVKTIATVPNQDMNRNQPAGSPSSVPGGQYRDISFPPSYPNFKPNNAAIQVTSNPAGASVYLDGSYKGITPSSGYLDISDLSPGTYTVRLTSSGYTDYSKEITLSRNECATISADLTEAYVPSQYGALSVQSDPSGAEVYLDNVYKGITPVTLQKIDIGSHTVLIKKSGYSEYSGDVNIISDQASGLSVTLTGSVTAVPTSATTSAPMQPPAPVPTKSPLSPWVPICGLTLVCLGFAVQRIRK
jgi:hypothetical protein